MMHTGSSCEAIVLFLFLAVSFLSFCYRNGFIMLNPILIPVLLPHSQPPVFMNMPIQNMFNFAHDYKVN
jgi:hypothetical protein